jgi:hypothetical protein
MVTHTCAIETDQLHGMDWISFALIVCINRSSSAIEIQIFDLKGKMRIRAGKGVGRLAAIQPTGGCKQPSATNMWIADDGGDRR